VAGFYAGHGQEYCNPHEPLVRRAVLESVRRWGLDLSSVLDLACGSGEATLPLLECGGTVAGADPYTAEAYQRRTGLPAAILTFEQVAAGALRGRQYSLVVCSYAMHLLEESRLPGLAMELALLTPTLLILTPHKRPVIRREWGWMLAGEQTFSSGEPEWVRVRARVCRSFN
jgi:hypothetical protein